MDMQPCTCRRAPHGGVTAGLSRPGARAQFQHSPGQLVNLLRVAVEESVAMGTRQAAAISFKNLVRRDWEGTGAPGPGGHAPAQAGREAVVWHRGERRCRQALRQARAWQGPLRPAMHGACRGRATSAFA
jgi:hypothetical protein